MTLGPVIDTHHHLWDLENNRYPWLQDGIDHPIGDYSPIRKSFLITDLLEGAKNISLDKSVHVQAEWNPEEDPVGETIWLQKVADSLGSNGMPNAIIGFADLSDPKVEKTLERHADNKNWRGIRQMLNWGEQTNLRFTDRPDLMSDNQWRDGYRLLKTFEGSFDLQVWPWQLEEGASLAMEIQNVPVILNHTGMPIYWDDNSREIWRHGMHTIAQVENVSVKISALGMFKQDWAIDDLRPWVLETIDLFGVDRCMFASNFPVDKLFSDYETLWLAYQEIVSDFSETEKKKLFHDNAEIYYRI